jgi:hypothetical protein
MITKIIKIICFWAFATSAIIAKGQTKLIDSLKTSVEQSKTKSNIYPLQPMAQPAC